MKVNMKIEEKERIIKCLQNNNGQQKYYHNNIPEEYKSDKEIIEAERKAGIRKIETIGFDVINQNFFVNENVLAFNNVIKTKTWFKDRKIFENFEDYYDYLDGEIYKNSCYYQCDFSKLNRKLSTKEINKNKCFVKENIDSYSEILTEQEIEEYNRSKKNKTYIKNWRNKFCSCKTLEELQETVKKYSKSSLSKEDIIDLDFFFWEYVFYDVGDRKRFDTIMKYMSTGDYPEWKMIEPLCRVYNADDVLNNFNYSAGVKQTREKHKKELKNYIERIKKENKKYEEHRKVFFDNKTHYYVEESNYGFKRFFENFDELVRYRKGDMSNADLRNALDLNYDFSKCIINENTKLPINRLNYPVYELKKEYYDNKFFVTQTWYDKAKNMGKCRKYEFKYFFDFVSFLKGDLSEANLLRCEGLKYLKDIKGINFNNAKITSRICEKLGINYKKCKFNFDQIKTYTQIEENEKRTDLILKDMRELQQSNKDKQLLYSQDGLYKQRISYVSDLHLLHKINAYCPKSENDLIYVLQKIVEQLVVEAQSIMLIAGDISSNVEIYELFLNLLNEEISRKRKATKVIITLGNHELWGFSSENFDNIVKFYNNLAIKYKMHLLQNKILYVDSWRTLKEITEDEILSLSIKELREILREARIIFFGGLAFSGYNEKFNADLGIYRDVITREEEINQTKRFEKLYNKIKETLCKRNVVIITHTPMDCWKKDIEYTSGFIYVSGHTHLNNYHDDGEMRIYSDNQIGYKAKTMHLKYFELEKEYDYFCYYKDGIYEITPDEYKSFYRGRNIMIAFTRDTYILWMLKKNDYYCFIHESKDGTLTILNGGALKKLAYKDINYYFNNMDKLIATIKKPLDKYSSLQKDISNRIKKIGGSGKIHGCIIDIDWYNHIYVNPVDLKITAYNALDIINKEVYPDISSLLKAEAPRLYLNYKNQKEVNSGKISDIEDVNKNEISVLPQTYLDTDIYKASREIKKMQRLDSKILTTWYEVDNNSKLIR